MFFVVTENLERCGVRRNVGEPYDIAEVDGAGGVGFSWYGLSTSKLICNSLRQHAFFGEKHFSQ